MAIVQADGQAMSGLERGTSVFRAKLWLPGQERSETVGGKYFVPISKENPSSKLKSHVYSKGEFTFEEIKILQIVKYE